MTSSTILYKLILFPVLNYNVTFEIDQRKCVKKRKISIYLLKEFALIKKKKKELVVALSSVKDIFLQALSLHYLLLEQILIKRIDNKKENF